MIKNFIYLDKDKMYSLSSQLFEGITEYLVSASSNENGEENSQRGPVGSGRLFADILKKVNTIEEKKYLHDYSYTIFEKHLIDEKKVININDISTDKFLSEINSHSFIKIKGKIIFNDIGHLSKVLKDSNKVADTLNRIQSRNKSKDIKKKVEVKKIDKEHVKDLLYLLEFGFGNQLEVQLNYNNYLFSSNIKREYLREIESLLINKYARQTEKEFTVFGIVTQCNGGNTSCFTSDATENSLKVSFMNIISKVANVEQSFTGKLENEIMIDPIAIYTEL